jgi:hypothetical protein
MALAAAAGIALAIPSAQAAETRVGVGVGPVGAGVMVGESRARAPPSSGKNAKSRTTRSLSGSTIAINDRARLSPQSPANPRGFSCQW